MGNQHHSWTYWLAWVSVIGIFSVNSMGFLDTVTGSAMGCGRNWPLCNGQVIPAGMSTATWIEFSHRLVVLLVAVFLLLSAVLAWRIYGKWMRVKLLVLATLGAVLAEGFLGALSVIFVNPPAVMAFHMGIALIAFASSFLLAVFIGQAEKGLARTEAAAHPLDRKISRWISFSVVYAYLAIYVGAYVSSTGDGASFQGWPFPTESYSDVGSALAVDILHRSVALGFVLVLLRLLRLVYQQRNKRPDLFKGAIWSLLLVVLQALSGGLMIARHISVGTFMLHVSIVSCLFASLCYLWMQSRANLS